jgi:hypothetical protein
LLKCFRGWSPWALLSTSILRTRCRRIVRQILSSCRLRKCWGRWFGLLPDARLCTTCAMLLIATDIPL